MMWSFQHLTHTVVQESLLVGCSLNIIVSLVFAGDRDHLVRADLAIKSLEFWVVTIYAPNITGEMLLPSIVGTVPWPSKMASFSTDWKIDRVGWSARRSDWWESSLINLMTWHNLFDRFCLNHPGSEMWTWTDSLSSVRARSYLDRILVRRADTEFVSCPIFHKIGQTDHRLVRVSLQLAYRASLARYWKFNNSLLRTWDFQEQLEKLI